MISLKKTLFIALFIGASNNVRSQYITIDESQTVEQLIRDVLIDNPCANVSNISVTGLNFGSGNSYGYFSAGSSTFPFSDGVVITTGRAASAVGPNGNILSEGPSDWAGDPDLEQALGVNNTINATVIEFDFLPLANKISFDYIFSSEQYLSNPSANQCNYTDGFAFLLKEASASSYENLALVPNSNTPVRVNTVRGPGTVCPPANEEYFDAFNQYDHPTNYNGQTVILTAESIVVPNTLYHIKLVIADQGNNLYDSAIFLGGGSFKVEKDLGPDRLIATGNALCPSEELILDATEPGTNTYQWYQNDSAISGATNPLYTVDEPGIYDVEITLNSTTCISTGEIEIEYATLPVVNSPVSMAECDGNNDGSAKFDLTQLNDDIAASGSIKYYPNLSDAQNSINEITNNTSFTGSDGMQLTAAVSNPAGCRSFATVNLQITNNPIAPIDPIQICDTDNDGIAPFNLSQMVTPVVLDGLPGGYTVAYYESSSDAEQQINALPNLFTNTQIGQQDIFARIVNGSDCFGIPTVRLIVNTFNPSGLDDETVNLCIGGSATLQVPSGYSQYLWSNGETDNSIAVTTGGNYSVTVTNSNGCTATKNFMVNTSEIATFVSADIRDFLGNQNSVEIIYSGSGDYTFSLDGVNYQDNAVFTDVAAGEYQVYIKDRKGCGIAGPFAIYVLDYPTFFTPNGDGFNDYWGVTFPEGRAGGNILIYDRYGKLLFTIRENGPQWDGTFNSNQLPATDYWFLIEFDDNRRVNGHFSLKR